MVRRVTAREFQKRFQRLEEPVLINTGIYFPVVTSTLLNEAESLEASFTASVMAQQAKTAQSKRDEILRKSRKKK